MSEIYKFWWKYLGLNLMIGKLDPDLTMSKSSV